MNKREFIVGIGVALLAKPLAAVAGLFKGDLSKDEVDSEYVDLVIDLINETVKNIRMPPTCVDYWPAVRKSHYQPNLLVLQMCFVADDYINAFYETAAWEGQEFLSKDGMEALNVVKSRVWAAQVRAKARARILGVTLVTREDYNAALAKYADERAATADKKEWSWMKPKVIKG